MQIDYINIFINIINHLIDYIDIE